jgi:hypothetical protein
MKFYIDVPVERRVEHNALRDHLVGLGHQITHDWTLHECDTPSQKAECDIVGITQADLLIALLPGGRAFHVEIGAALSQGVRVFLVGDPYDPSGKKCVFYDHPLVIHFYDVDAMVAFLQVGVTFGT